MAHLESPNRSGGRRRRSMNEINMVPFIDVMLVLLIIFMVTAPMISQGVVDLPSVGSASKKEQPQPPQLITFQQDGTIEYQEAGSRSRTTFATVEELLGSGMLAADVPVVVYADKTETYEAVLQRVDALRRAGVQKVGLGVQTSGS